MQSTDYYSDDIDADGSKISGVNSFCDGQVIGFHSDSQREGSQQSGCGDPSDKKLFMETLVNVRINFWTLTFLNTNVQNRFESFCLKQYPWFFVFSFFTFPYIIGILYFYVELLRVNNLADSALISCSISFFMSLLVLIFYKMKLWGWLQFNRRAVQTTRTHEFIYDQSSRTVFILGNISGVACILSLGIYCIISATVKSCIYFCYADVPIVLAITTFYMPFHIMVFVHLDWIYVIGMNFISCISLIVTFAVKGLISAKLSSIFSVGALSFLCSFYFINMYFYYHMKLILFKNSEIFSAVLAEERRLLKDADGMLDIFF